MTTPQSLHGEAPESEILSNDTLHRKLGSAILPKKSCVFHRKRLKHEHEHSGAAGTRRSLRCTAKIGTQENGVAGTKKTATRIAPTELVFEVLETVAQERPLNESSFGSFAQRCLSVINRIPNGKVATYGQVATLAGAPRNAREVGRMLGDGLAAGGAPWHRVLNASGKISLSPKLGGDRQRELLEAEDVTFRGDRVLQTDMWYPECPDEFFVGWGR